MMQVSISFSEDCRIIGLVLDKQLSQTSSSTFLAHPELVRRLFLDDPPTTIDFHVEPDSNQIAKALTSHPAVKREAAAFFSLS